MRHSLLLFLLLLMPFQSALAASAAYCDHEAQESSHFGHHQHQHHPSEADGSTALGGDSDCSIHHLCGVALVPAPAILAFDQRARMDIASLATAFRSLPAYRPERPNWSAAL